MHVISKKVNSIYHRKNKKKYMKNDLLKQGFDN